MTTSRDQRGEKWCQRCGHGHAARGHDQKCSAQDFDDKHECACPTFQPSDEGRGAAWCNKCGHRGHKALECLSGETGNVCPCPYHSAPAAKSERCPGSVPHPEGLAVHLYCLLPKGHSGPHSQAKPEPAVGVDRYSDDRLSLAQEIAETLKSRGHWVPANYAGPDLIMAVGKALDAMPPTETAKGGEAKVNEHAAWLREYAEQVPSWDREYIRNHARAAAAEIERLERERDAWKNAIIDATVVDWIYKKEHESDPRLAVNDLLAWQSKLALDPAVSKEAHDLYAERDRLAAELARAREDVAATHADYKCMEDDLRTKLAEATKEVDALAEQVDVYMDQRDAALAREARLREALKRIIEGATVALVRNKSFELKTEGGTILGLARWILDDDLERARAALSASPAKSTS